MSKYFGEMSKEEFNDAMKEIMAYKKDKAEKKTTTDEAKEFFSQCSSFFCKFKNFFSTPCTKEVFIKRGISFKLCVLDIIETVVFVVVAIIILKFFIGEIRWIPSGSMKPTLIEGDKVFIERFSRFVSTPKRGDIMVFYPPFVELENTPIKLFKRLTGFFCDDVAYIKRVIGLPGEKYEIKPDYDGIYHVYINDMMLNEPYIKNPLEFSPCTEEMFCGPAIIPENQYLMLGDNRGNSKDGRYWGLLPKDRFIGKAVQVFRFSSLSLNKRPNQYE